MEDKYAGTTPENAVDKGRDEGDLEGRSTGSNEPREDRKNEVDPDNNPNTVEEVEPEATKPPEEKDGSSDSNLGKGQTNITVTVVRKDKGQEEKERKEEQVNGKRDPDKFGPNETKLKTAVPDGGNTVEIFELDMTKNNTVTQESKDTNKENNNSVSPTSGRKVFPTRVNVTQYTLYRAEEETGKSKENTSVKKFETGGESWEKTREMETKKEEEEKEQERGINQSFLGKRFMEKCKSG